MEHSSLEKTETPVQQIVPVHSQEAKVVQLEPKLLPRKEEIEKLKRDIAATKEARQQLEIMKNYGSVISDAMPANITKNAKAPLEEMQARLEELIQEKKKNPLSRLRHMLFNF